jgi:hypothetical protein
MRLPSASTAPASYPHLQLTSCKRYPTNSTLGVSVRSFAGRAGWRMRKHFLVNHRVSNAGPTVSSLITRSRFTTRLKASVVEEGNDATGSRLNSKLLGPRRQVRVSRLLGGLSRRRGVSAWQHGCRYGQLLTHRKRLFGFGIEPLGKQPEPIGIVRKSSEYRKAEFERRQRFPFSQRAPGRLCSFRMRLIRTSYVTAL